MRLFLPIYLILFGAIFFWHTLSVWRKTGINPYVLHKAEGAQAVVAGLFRPLGLLLAIIVACFLFYPSLSLYFCPINNLEITFVKYTGVVFLVVALAWVFFAQAQMGSSWRIGIDDENHTGLVSHGLFNYSRNPVFLGVRLCLLGLFMVIPSLTMLFVVLVLELLIQLQVRFEEDHLLALHGEEYLKYCQQVRRWL